MRISDWSSDVCSSDLVPAESIDKLQGATLDLPAGGGAGLVLRNPNRPNPLSGKHLELTGTIAEQVEQLLKEQINPALAAHGGFAALKGVDDDKVYVTMGGGRSEEHTSDLQSLMRITYAVFCLKKK